MGLIPLYEGSELHAELTIIEDKGYLKYYWQGREIVEDSLFESFNSKVFDFFLFIARGIISHNYKNATLWSY